MAAVEENGPGADAPGLVVERRGACGEIVLQRPGARNALSPVMVGQLLQAYPAFARDPIVYATVVRSTVAGHFSDDGAEASLSVLAKADLAAARRHLADVLQLCWLQECYSKPTVSLIDGPVSGAGIGISLYGTHRVAGAGYRFQVAEVQRGLVPGCGVLHALSRLPDHVGLYLALTGRSIGREDAYPLGLVTHCIEARQFADITAALADADPVDPLLDTRHADPAPSPLKAEGARIRRYFEGDDAGAIFARLAAAPENERRWADGVLADMALGSPMAVRATVRAMAAARALDLRDMLILEYRLGYRLVAGSDVLGASEAPSREGAPDALAQITDSQMDALFAPLGADDLVLKTRAEMQAARV